jgi:hypothetical protein
MNGNNKMDNKDYIIVNKKYIDTLYEYAEELKHEPGIHTQGISKGIKYTLDKILEQNETTNHEPKGLGVGGESF